jgi:methylthioribose-1-phosphate isomerase
MKTHMMFQTVDWKNGCVVLIDQTQLPKRLVSVRCRRVDEVRDAIKKLKVRGAPAIGVAAAFGVLLAFRGVRTQKTQALLQQVKKASARLASARPTAVNLSWALERMGRLAQKNVNLSVSHFREALLNEALAIRDEDRSLCDAIGQHGAGLFKRGDRVLTHCNAGALATAGIGTALGVVYTAQDKGKNLSVYCPETRPLLQGARLSAWELVRRKIGATVICDSMVATVMKQGKIDRVIVGADRIAANGDVANKIGTYSIACLARIHKIPFYVAAPSSTFDFSISTGCQIPIEQRAPHEITQPFGQTTAPRGVQVFNPAFDVTPAKYITGIITDQGVVYPPYRSRLKKLLRSPCS